MIAAKASGQQHPLLRDAPVLPVGCELLWGDFLELHQDRGSTGMAPARITRRDIREYCRDTGATLAPWQVAAIRKADEAWFARRAAQQ